MYRNNGSSNTWPADGRVVFMLYDCSGLIIQYLYYPRELRILPPKNKVIHNYYQQEIFLFIFIYQYVTVFIACFLYSEKEIFLWGNTCG